MAEVRIDVHIEGLRQVQAALDRAIRALDRDSLQESLGRGADVFVEVEQVVAPHRTGALAGSVTKDEASDGAGWRIGPHTIYARIQDRGGTNRPHGRYLVFEGDYGGTVFARKVTIPGRRYVDAAFEDGKEPAAKAVTGDVISRMKG